MKYEMPALTDEQREKAIRECLKEICGLKAEIEVNVRFGAPCEPYATRLICHQIALSALTSEPEYNTSDAEDVHLDVKKSAYDRCHPDYRWISYTAPPVPALKPIKMPEQTYVREPGFIGWVYDGDEVDEAIRAAGYEVKND